MGPGVRHNMLSQIKTAEISFTAAVRDLRKPSGFTDGNDFKLVFVVSLASMSKMPYRTCRYLVSKISVEEFLMYLKIKMGMEGTKCRLSL